jgi:antibiotic biosynthesis monooxygenase (ABM) superfamily enzyme
MLDQVANEERLQMTFENLFAMDGNTTLSAYLTQIYRFLGLYVLGIGFLLLSFTPKKFMEIRIVRQRVLIVLFIMLVSNLIIGYVWIPSSHFIYVMWGAIMLCVYSIYHHIKS